MQSGETISLDLGDQTVELTAEDVLVQTESRGGAAVASEKGVTVAVDTELTPALIQEGFARDLIRQLNNMRKDAGLEISDRIAVGYTADGETAAALTNFADFIQAETLAQTLAAGLLDSPLASETVTVGDSEVTLTLQKTG